VNPIEKGMFDILICGEPIDSRKTFTRLVVAGGLLKMKVLLQVKSSPYHTYRKHPGEAILSGDCQLLPFTGDQRTAGSAASGHSLNNVRG
jgi:hypothetical protein